MVFTHDHFFMVVFVLMSDSRSDKNRVHRAVIVVTGVSFVKIRRW